MISAHYAQSGRDNNFHLIRHLAALAVVLTHSYAVVTGQYSSEPLVSLLGRSIGHYAVDVFFVLSGFVVTQSLARNANLTRFAVSRVLRIFPALIVAVLATAFILGPAVSTSRRRPRRAIVHRLSSSGPEVRVLEVAFGNWQQADISRYEDDYKRPDQGEEDE